MVYVTQQQTVNGVDWYVAYYNGNAGYIRADQMLRKMTEAEINKYMAGQKTTAPTSPSRGSATATLSNLSRRAATPSPTTPAAISTPPTAPPATAT